MAFELDHWDNPRATIACIHMKDDISYAIHGAQMAADAINLFDLKPSNMKGLTIIDYGCGTGRISRVLARFFKHVYAFDPNKACYEAALKECPEIKIPNLTFFNDFSHVPEADLSICVNVVEHLHDTAAQFAIDSALSKSLALALWYPKGARYMAKYSVTNEVGQRIMVGLVQKK